MYKNLPAALKLAINVIIIVALLAALFVAGLAIYGKVMNMSFSDAWAAFVEACRGGNAAVSTRIV